MHQVAADPPTPSEGDRAAGRRGCGTPQHRGASAAPLAQAVTLRAGSGRGAGGSGRRSAYSVKKFELELLDDARDAGGADGAAGAAGAEAGRPPGAGGGQADFDPPALRELARRLAEHWVVFLANGARGAAAGGRRAGRRGGAAGRRPACRVFGSYTFPRHVLVVASGSRSLGSAADTVPGRAPGRAPAGPGSGHARGCGVCRPGPVRFCPRHWDSARSADVAGCGARRPGRACSAAAVAGEGSDACSSCGCLGFRRTCSRSLVETRDAGGGRC